MLQFEAKCYELFVWKIVKIKKKSIFSALTMHTMGWLCLAMSSTPKIKYLG